MYVGEATGNYKLETYVKMRITIVTVYTCRVYCIV